MRVISKARLVEFWRSRKADPATAERDLSAWCKIASAARWSGFAALKQTFGSADQVGNCVVFDVGNNRFRLVGRVRYAKGGAGGKIDVLKVMDHAEYDKNQWADSCGCHRPPPKAGAAKGTPTRRVPEKKDG